MRRKNLVSTADARRAADAKLHGIERAAEIHRLSETAIRRSIRNAQEANSARQLLALLDSPTEGTQQ